MKKLITLLTFVCIVSICGAAEEKSPVRVFAFGGVGFAGITNEGEYRFSEAVRSKNPKAAFHRWYKKGKNVEKAYCMVGFYYFDREQYNELKKQYQGKGVSIHTMSGCLAETITLDRLMTRIEMEQFKLYLDNPIERPLLSFGEN